MSRSFVTVGYVLRGRKCTGRESGGLGSTHVPPPTHPDLGKVPFLMELASTPLKGSG